MRIGAAEQVAAAAATAATVKKEPTAEVDVALFPVDSDEAVAVVDTISHKNNSLEEACNAGVAVEALSSIEGETVAVT